jgi:hypothetical protein
MNYKSLLVGVILAVPMLITGCSNNPNGGNGKGISIALTAPPPANMEVNNSVSVTATVTGDRSKMGVDWSCTPLGACGTFNPAHTASGVATTYTAPDVAGPVTITAASTKNPAKTAPANISITAVATTSDISGNFTFFANGVEKNLSLPYGVAGNIAINGATGMITGGEQDYFDAHTGNVFTADVIQSGTINVGSDGRGTLTLTPTTAPAETFSITVVNDKHILITEFDGNAAASGSLDLQTAPTTVPTGANAFAVLDSFNAIALGGVLTSNGTVTTASEADDDIGGFQDFDLVNTVTGAFTAPDASGRGTVTLSDPNLALAGFTGSMQMAYYVVGPEAFRLIEIDGNGTTILQYGVGSMFGQGAGAFSGASLGSKFVFGQSGIEDIAFGAYSAAGQFTGNGTTALSAGVADANLGDGNQVLAGGLTGSAYAVNADGYAFITLSGANTDGLANFGVYMVDPAINVADPNNASGGGGAVMLDLDTDNLGIGIVVPQAAGPTFTGNYALSQDGVFQTAAAFSWYGLLGQVASDGTSKIAGLADYNQLNFSQTAGVTVSGTYTADANNAGRSTATVTINGAATPNHITVYQASSALLLHVDTDTSTNGAQDLGTIGLGVLEQQQ